MLKNPSRLLGCFLISRSYRNIERKFSETRFPKDKAALVTMALKRTIVVCFIHTSLGIHLICFFFKKFRLSGFYNSWDIYVHTDRRTTYSQEDVGEILKRISLDLFWAKLIVLLGFFRGPPFKQCLSIDSKVFNGHAAQSNNSP